MKVLIVVDMQVDFINGNLGTPYAEAIVDRVVEKVRGYDGAVIFTRDTHGEDYLDTREGRYLPVKHCIKGTRGFEICDELKPYADTVVDKITFGSTDLPDVIRGLGGDIDEIELCGLCTDICVISNAMILKAAFPECDIKVDGAYCAGVTPESHIAALDAMRCVQIDVKPES